MKKAFKIAATAVFCVYVTAGLAAVVRNAVKVSAIERADPIGRTLTPNEVAFARGIFGDTLDYARIRLHKAPAKGDGAITAGDHIYMELPRLQAPDLTAEGNSNFARRRLAHELTHVWQKQKLTPDEFAALEWRSMPGKAMYALFHSTGVYDYRGTTGNFRELNQEQQAAMASDYAEAQLISDSPRCNPRFREGPDVVCDGANAQVALLAPRLKPALPLPGFPKL
jgi:type VI secretion system secreted protein VgrG